MADPTTDERAPLDDEVFALVRAARPPAVPFDAVRRETVRSLLGGATPDVRVADHGASSDRALDGSGASDVDIEAGAMAAAGGDRAGARGRRRVRVAAWLVAAAVIAGAVGLATRSGDQRRVATSDGEVGWQVPVLADLVGTTYRWTSATENGAALALLPEFTVGFGDPLGDGTPHVSAATCNGNSGRATIRAGRLVVAEYGGTQMFCGDARGAAERFWNDLLAEEPEIAVRGDELRLRSASRELVATSTGRALASLRPATATELERTRWMIFAASMSDTTPNWGELWFGRDSLAIGGVCGARKAPMTLADGSLSLGASDDGWLWPGRADADCLQVDLEPLDRFLRLGAKISLRGDVLRADGPDGWLEAVRLRPDVDLDAGGVPSLAIDPVGYAGTGAVRFQIDTITDAHGTVNASGEAGAPVVLSVDAPDQSGVALVRIEGLCQEPSGTMTPLGIGIEVKLGAASSSGGSCPGSTDESSPIEALLRGAFAHPLAWLGSSDRLVLARSDVELALHQIAAGVPSPTAPPLVPPTAAAAPLPTGPTTSASPTTALPSGRPATVDDVEGRTFSVTTFVVGGSARDVSFGQPSLVFTSTPDGLKLDAGACLHGIVTIDAGRLHGTVDRTPRACGADLHQLDEPLKSLLNGEPAITIDGSGRLTVTGADARIVTDFRETRRDEHVPTLEELSGRSFAVDEVVHGFVGRAAAAVIEFDGDTGAARWLTVTANGSCSSRRFIDLTIASGRLAGNRDGTRDPSCAATASEDLLLALVAGNPRITLEPPGGPSVATLLLDNGGDSVRAVEVVAPKLADTTWRYAGLRAEPTGEAPGATASHGIDAALRFTGAWSGGSDGWRIEGPCASLSGTVEVAGPPHRTYLTVTGDLSSVAACDLSPEAQDEWRRLREIVLAVSDLRADAAFLRLTAADGRMALFTRA